MLDVGLSAKAVWICCPLEIAKDSSCVITQESFRCHLVPMLGAPLPHTVEPRSDLYAFHRIYRHHRMSDICIKPVKDRFSESSRHPSA